MRIVILPPSIYDYARSMGLEMSRYRRGEG
jgi:hypothetical protein